METTTQAILEEVAGERARQDGKWGGASKDDQWNALDWHEMIADYNAWARRMATMGSVSKARNRYVQIAALAVAAVESIDRKGNVEAGGHALPASRQNSESKPAADFDSELDQIALEAMKALIMAKGGIPHSSGIAAMAYDMAEAMRAKKLVIRQRVQAEGQKA